MADWPGLRRVICGWISSSASCKPGGQPSTMQPTLLPWDSPYVVTRKYCPNVDIVWAVGIQRLDEVIRCESKLLCRPGA